jgi:hypothetical protein
MAVRLRKLAKELDLDVEQALVCLAEIGIDRYRTPEDMVPDPTAEKLRRHVKDLRRRGRPLSAGAGPARPPVRAPSPGRAAVPKDQVERLGDALDLPLDAVATEVAPADRVQAEIAVASDRVRAEQAALHAQARRLQERSAHLEAEAERLRAERDALEAERDALHAERRALRDELATAQADLASRAADLDAIEAGGVPLARLLDERGLRGVDEHGRAVAALARARLLDAIVARLRVVDAGPVRQLLRDRLVLGTTPIDALEGAAWVQVAPDRAEVPSADEVVRLRDRLWGEFLLCGCRRVRVVGACGHEARMLRESVDPRLSVEIISAVHRDGPSAREDLANADLVVLRDVELSGSAEAAYAEAPGRVVRASAPGLAGLVADVLAALAPG